MSLFGKNIKSMDNLFTHTLQDIYYAENQILKALPEMVQKASNPKLKTALKSHFEETKKHVKRLEEVFRMCGQNPKGVQLSGDRRHHRGSAGHGGRRRRQQRARCSAGCGRAGGGAL
jgi:hypothetical protein